MVTTGPDVDTGNLYGARDHARAQAGATAPTMLTIPATAATDLPDGVEPAQVRWDETVGSGGYAARRLRRGTVLRIADLAGDACVNLQLVSAIDTFEKLNPPDTVKVQWQAYLDTGAVLLSGQGRALATLAGDSSGRHDALCGHGRRRPRPTAELLGLAAARFGLTRRDLNAGVNLFKSVRVADDGSLRFDGEATAPSFVDLRLELDLIVVLANAPHPLDPRDQVEADVRLTAWTAPHPEPDDDPWRRTTPERERAFLNTDDHLLGARP